MKLKTIEGAFNCAIAGTNEPNHLETLLKARDEIIALAKLCEDGLDTECSIVSWYALSNLMNVATYYEFGKIRKKYLHNTRAETRQYRECCRNLICEELTDVQIDGAASFLRDLWDDNETDGSHNPDGSFDRSEPCKNCHDLKARIERLGDIINKLYHHRGLSADDITDIQLFIH